MFSKSEKWIPIVAVIWGIAMLTAGFVCAWQDSERYASMMKAVGESAQIIIGVLVAAAIAYSKIRMDYKAKLTTNTGTTPEKETRG